MNKFIVSFIACAMTLGVAVADTVYTNQMGQTFTIDTVKTGIASLTSGIDATGDATQYVTYDLDKVSATTVASNTATYTLDAEIMYLSGSGVSASNVAFATPYPTSKRVLLVNIGTNVITLDDSAVFDIGSADMPLDPHESVEVLAVSTGLCIKVDRQ